MKRERIYSRYGVFVHSVADSLGAVLSPTYRLPLTFAQSLEEAGKVFLPAAARIVWFGWKLDGALLVRVQTSLQELDHGADLCPDTTRHVIKVDDVRAAAALRQQFLVEARCHSQFATPLKTRVNGNLKKEIAELEKQLGKTELYPLLFPRPAQRDR